MRALNGSCQTGATRRSASARAPPRYRRRRHRRRQRSPVTSRLSSSSAISATSGPTAAARRIRSAAAGSASPAGAAQSSIGTITIAGPRCVAASCAARAIAPGTSCARTGWSTQTGYSPASLSRRPARNGSSARWRRSCWPTSTTSGARFTRAVASADDRVAEPGRRVEQCKRGLVAAEREARRHADHAGPRGAPSTKWRSSGSPVRNGTSVEPGFANSVVSPCRRRTSNVASRTVAPCAPGVSRNHLTFSPGG